MLKNCFNIITLVIINITYVSATMAQENNYCGQNLLPNSPNIEYFRAIISQSSNANTNLINSSMSQAQATFNSQDQSLIVKIRDNKPFIIRRQPSKYLCQVFADDGIKSFGANTPQVEKNLYSAGNCVFVSFGSPVGQPIWGDALMTFKEGSLNGAWATPHSGWYYASLHRFGYTDSNLNLSETVDQTEKNFFMQFIYTDQRQWYDIMLDNFMIRYKALPTTTQTEIFNKLINIPDRKTFQTTLAQISYQYKLEYYMETHLDTFVSLDSVQSIEVPGSAIGYFQTNCPVPFQKWSHKIITNSPPGVTQ